MWGMERRSRWSFEYATSISQFSFLILYFSFLIFHFRFPRVSAFRQTPPSTRLGNRGQSCLSTDCRRADFPDLTPTQPGRLHASPHCRFVKLSGLGRKTSESIKSEIISSLFHAPEQRTGEAFSISLKKADAACGLHPLWVGVRRKITLQLLSCCGTRSAHLHPPQTFQGVFRAAHAAPLSPL